MLKICKNTSIGYHHSVLCFLQLQFPHTRSFWSFFCCSKSKLQYLWGWSLKPLLLGHLWSLEVQYVHMALLCSTPYFSSLPKTAINFIEHSLLGGCRAVRTQWKREGERVRRWKELWGIGHGRAVMGESREGRAKLLANLGNHIHVT